MISVLKLVATLALGALWLLGLSGCDRATGVAAAVAGKSSSGDASVLIDSVNYMHEQGVQYTLYDLSQTPPRAIGGAFVNPLATGGEKGCCIALPRPWRSGMKVRLEWKESDFTKTSEKRTQDFEIPRYDTPADLYVVFYPPHDVELVVSAGEPGNPAWAGRIKKTPWEQCVESYGRKPCFMALPKQFDTKSSQGACAYAIKENRPHASDNCWWATKECMRDYEDESFCKGILWGPRRKE